MWKYKDIIIFRADYGDPISTEYGHIDNCSNVSISSPARALIVDKISIYRK